MMFLDMVFGMVGIGILIGLVFSFDSMLLIMWVGLCRVLFFMFFSFLIGLVEWIMLGLWIYVLSILMFEYLLFWKFLLIICWNVSEVVIGLVIMNGSLKIFVCGKWLGV